MHTYYNSKPDDPGNKRSRRGYRRSPGRADFPQQSATSSWKNEPSLSLSRIRHGTDYTPVRMKEPGTSPAGKREKNTDTELPKIVSRQGRVLREQDTQKLITYPTEEKRQVPVESDDPLSDHLESLTAEIQWLYKRLRSLFWLIVILVCLAIILQVWLQEVATWINLIYAITGIIASIIVIIEFKRRIR